MWLVHRKHWTNVSPPPESSAVNPIFQIRKLNLNEVKWSAWDHRRVKLQRRDSQPQIWCSEHWTTLSPISHFHRLTIWSRVLSSAAVGVINSTVLIGCSHLFSKSKLGLGKTVPPYYLTWILFLELQIQSQPQTAVRGWQCPPTLPSHLVLSAALYAVESGWEAPPPANLFSSVPLGPWFQTGNLRNPIFVSFFDDSKDGKVTVLLFN